MFVQENIVRTIAEFMELTWAQVALLMEAIPYRMERAEAVERNARAFEDFKMRFFKAHGRRKR